MESVGVVHSVRWSDTGCALESLWRGQLVSRSLASDLRHALLRDFQAVDATRDPRFDYVGHQVAGAGNVSFRCPLETSPRLTFYPGGFLFMLRCVLPEHEAERAARARQVVSRPEAGLDLERAGEQSGWLLVLDPRGAISEERVILIDCSARLQQLVNATRHLVDSGAVRHEPPFALSVVEASSATPEHLRLQPGFAEARGASHIAYTVVGADCPVAFDEVKQLLRAHGPRIVD
jgi:hypothetical protein